MKKIVMLGVLLAGVTFIYSCSGNNAGTGPTANPTPTPTFSSPWTPAPPAPTSTFTPTLCPGCPTLTPTPSPTPTLSPTPCTAPVSMFFKATGDTTRQQITTYGNQSSYAAVTQNPPYTSSLLPYCSGDQLYISAYYNDVVGGASTVAIFNASSTPVATHADNIYVVNGLGVTTGSGMSTTNYTMP